MKRAIFLLSSMMLAGISINTFADSYGPLPHCYKPTKPLWLATVYYRNRYTRDVSEYQRCMKAFIVDQERAVKIHTHAAQAALTSWNEFAKEQAK